MLQREEDRELFRARMDELAGRICAAASLQAESDCQFLELVAEFDAAGGIGFWRDVKSLAHWLSWTCSIAPGTAREQVRVARSLATMPRVTAAFREGRLSYSKVRELSRVAGVIDDELLCSFGLTMTASQLARTVRGFRTSAGLRAQGAAAERMTWTTTEDRMMTFKIKVAADEGAHLVAAIDRAMDLGEGETRRVDAVIDIAKAYLNAAPEDLSGEDRHLVVVHTSVETLAGYHPDTLPALDPESRTTLQAETPATHPDRTPTDLIIRKPARGDTQPPAASAAQTPAHSTTQTPAHPATQTTARSAAQTPGHVPTQTPARTVTQAPAHSDTQTPARTITQTPAHSVTQTPAHTVTEVPVRSGGQAQFQTSAQAPGRTGTEALVDSDTGRRAEPATHTMVDVSTRAMAGSGTGTPLGSSSAPLVSSGGAEAARNVPAGTAQHETNPDVPTGTVGHAADPNPRTGTVANPVHPDPLTETVTNPAHPNPPTETVAHAADLEVLAGTVAHSASPNVPAGTPTHELPTAPAAQAARAGIRGLGGIEPATAQRLACDSDLLAAVLDRDGTVLAVSDRQRLVTRRQRRALMIRDQGMCQFPGCSRTRLLKAHHLRHWAHGGRTELENLILLCQFHHTCVHEGGMTIQPAESLAGIRRWDFVLPDGECVRPEEFTEDQTLRNRLAWQAQRRRQEAAQRLSRVDGFRHPDARRVLPRWAGERFDLYAAVEALYGSLLDRDDRAA